MSLLDYRFNSRWLLKSPPEEVIRLLQDVQDLPRWLPRVAPRVEILAQRQSEFEILMWIRGWLPHSLRLHLRSRNCGGSLIIHAKGDLQGGGRWVAKPATEGCELTFQCHIKARNPILAFLSFVFRPVCVSNHKWVMRKVREGLEEQLGGERRGLPADSQVARK